MNDDPYYDSAVPALDRLCDVQGPTRWIVRLARYFMRKWHFVPDEKG